MFKLYLFAMLLICLSMHTESGILDPIYNQIVNQLIQSTKSLNATKFVCSSKANLTTCRM
jgi:hypothetical protein